MGLVAKCLRVPPRSPLGWRELHTLAAGATGCWHVTAESWCENLPWQKGITWSHVMSPSQGKPAANAEQWGHLRDWPLCLSKGQPVGISVLGSLKNHLRSVLQLYHGSVLPCGQPCFILSLVCVIPKTNSQQISSAQIPSFESVPREPREGSVHRQQALIAARSHSCSCVREGFYVFYLSLSEFSFFSVFYYFPQIYWN